MTYDPRIIVLQPKHPSETVDYPINLAPWLPTGDTATTINSCTASAGLTIASSPAPAIVDSILTFWVTGGTSGNTYLVQVVFTTASGRVLVIDFQISVLDPTP